jgi:excinuclease ABC subunit A
VIDTGPEGGDRIVAQGTPEEIAKNPASHTGRFLAEVLARRPVKRAGEAGRRTGDAPQDRARSGHACFGLARTLSRVPGGTGAPAPA